MPGRRLKADETAWRFAIIFAIGISGHRAGVFPPQAQTIMMSFNRCLRLLAIGTALASSAAAQQINLPPSGPTVFVGSWGAFGGGLGGDFGQSFTAPVGVNSLDSFSFQFGGNGAALQFRAYIAMFNTDTSPVGTILWQSALTNGLNTPLGLRNPLNPALGTAPLLVQFLFATGGVTVSAGMKYIAFVDASPYVAAGGTANMGTDYTSFANDYPFGEFCYNGSINGNFANVTGNGWTCGKADIAFTASFSNIALSAVPEPATIWLTIAGLAGLAVASRHRRRA